MGPWRFQYNTLRKRDEDKNMSAINSSQAKNKLCMQNASSFFVVHIKALRNARSFSLLPMQIKS